MSKEHNKEIVKRFRIIKILNTSYALWKAFPDILVTCTNTECGGHLRPYETHIECSKAGRVMTLHVQVN
jgi:hypothetical protein